MRKLLKDRGRAHHRASVAGSFLLDRGGSIQQDSPAPGCPAPSPPTFHQVEAEMSLVSGHFTSLCHQVLFFLKKEMTESWLGMGHKAPSCTQGVSRLLRGCAIRVIGRYGASGTPELADCVSRWMQPGAQESLEKLQSTVEDCSMPRAKCSLWHQGS